MAHTSRAAGRAAVCISAEDRFGLRGCCCRGCGGCRTHGFWHSSSRGGGDNTNNNIVIIIVSGSIIIIIIGSSSNIIIIGSSSNIIIIISSSSSSNNNNNSNNNTHRRCCFRGQRWRRRYCKWQLECCLCRRLIQRRALRGGSLANVVSGASSRACAAPPAHGSVSMVLEGPEPAVDALGRRS
jgi:hypothetical protein